jgi:hypothetical protein
LFFAPNYAMLINEQNRKESFRARCGGLASNS